MSHTHTHNRPELRIHFREIALTPDLSRAAHIEEMDGYKMGGGENSVHPLSCPVAMMILCDVVEHHCADVSDSVCRQRLGTRLCLQSL